MLVMFMSPINYNIFAINIERRTLDHLVSQYSIVSQLTTFVEAMAVEAAFIAQ